MPQLKTWQWVALFAVAAALIWYYRKRAPATAVATSVGAVDSSVPIVTAVNTGPLPPFFPNQHPTASASVPIASLPVLLGSSSAPAVRPLPQPPAPIYVTPPSQGGLDPRYGYAGENIIT